MWWQYIAIPALLAAGIYGFVVLVRHMTQQVTRETDRRAEHMYDEFGSTRKERIGGPSKRCPLEPATPATLMPR